MKIRNFTDIRALLFNNITVKQTILKNTFWLTLGSGVSKVLSFILLIYVARILGATEYGKFTFALAFVSLLALFADLGVSDILVREFAKEKERERDLYSLLSLKMLLGLGMLTLVLIGSFFITPDPLIQKIILILALYVLIDSFNGLSYSFFQARQRMEYQTVAIIFGTLVLTTFGLFVIFNFPSAENLSYAYLLANIITLIFISFFFHFKIFPLKVSWDKTVWQKFLSMSWPLALAALFITLYSYTDSVMLGYFGQITETGWYNAAYRIAWASFFLINPVCGSFVPILSKAFNESKEKLQKIWNYFMELMIILAFPLITGGIVLAPRIIDSFYGATFTPSILAFRILIIMTGIIFLYVPLHQILFVSNQQKKLFWAISIGAIINVILNLIFIPKYSLYGAAMTTVFTHLLILILFFNFTLKFTSINLFNLRFLYIFIGAILSSLVMFLVISFPQIYFLNVFLSVFIGAGVYLFCIFFCRKLINQFLIK